jgi:hypothetical protein
MGFSVPTDHPRVWRYLLLKKETEMMSFMKLNRIVGVFALTASLGGPGIALAQTAPASSPMKTIGTPAAAAKPQIVPSLFVLNSRGATLQGDTLTLTGVGHALWDEVRRIGEKRC